MTNIKLLLESDFVAHHKVHSVVQADCLTTDCEKFDLDDMPSPIQIIPFERYLQIESKTTGEDGALMESPAINALGFEYRRISHNYAFSLS